MYRILFLFVFVLFYSVPALAEDWGVTGHRVVGEIAEKYLDRKASKAISVLLDGHSLAFVGPFGDDIKSNREFDSFKPWHYVNFPFGERYETYPKSEEGDIINGIYACITILKDEKSSKDEKAFYLKLLVHFIGDLHQPLHIGKLDDKGGNDFQVRWFGNGTNLHKVWDSEMLDSYKMSYTEVARNADVLSKKEVEAIKSGTVLDWMYESRALCEDIYDNSEVGEKLGYNYMYKYMDTVRFQLQKGGIRLASLLNDIFG
ncbi:S1/P1 Nuclease [Aequorivita sp. H23M31]|uniref:S1/P1 Nuclease n=1 Tax=Aequorivita ciconiae TaxID=2494375 RepID=A0A410G1P3_9FLAO|nr:S1/P1 nuclease [Aequorivita sp. H23M31]QAA81182.1 S1/P1 Nuclease [Aequorivita sp. H23M31]